MTYRATTLQRSRSAAPIRFVRPLVVLAVLVCGLPLPAVAAPITIQIQEVLYDAAGTDAPGVFTEIFGAPGMNLDGWSLVGINGGSGEPYRTIDLSGAVIPNDGLLVVATSSAEPALAAMRDFVGSVDWQNGPDAVQLVDPFSIIVDALQYGDAGIFNAGFGTPALDAPAGSSLSRDIFGTNTGVNFVDFTISTPSPGIGPSLPGPNPQPVPEPSTIALTTCGLLWTVARRYLRRH